MCLLSECLTLKSAIYLSFIARWLSFFPLTLNHSLVKKYQGFGKTRRPKPYGGVLDLKLWRNAFIFKHDSLPHHLLWERKDFMASFDSSLMHYSWMEYLCQIGDWLASFAALLIFMLLGFSARLFFPLSCSSIWMSYPSL